MKKAHIGLVGAIAVVLGGFQVAVSQNVEKTATQIKGLPASDVLGSEDLWGNPTFVGGVIDGGPSASSEY
ncbi:MAG TPA: hypothetical protein VMF91_07620 [Bryobacteraceae bacterium]|jgi:hypothetical protein|nr:hypothetical protein [Bryobacteraceae bacterium]